LTGDGNISLTEDVTYLISDTPKDAGDLSVPYAVVLPDGNSLRQTKRIYVKKDNSLTTAKFQVAGNFIGCTYINFDTIGWSAVLEWVGDGWTMVGGNAARE